ncbi:MAG: adenosylcobinamide-phosphate synthase CbiB [Alistipes sp.]|jgi:adenosylcobinamide-phosphate synthase|nr:adenosylcobinamide-phosphate synthase CbiB [Alistipes sp.]
MDFTLIVFALGPLVAGWLLDMALGDPAWLPHPVVGFGRLIAAGERWLNRPSQPVGAQQLGEERPSRARARMYKGMALAVGLIAAAAAATWGLLAGLAKVSPWLWATGATVLIFCSLAGRTLRKEVREVFRAVDRSTEEGRAQVARIVGRDTSGLSEQEVRTAALETLAENLSDGVVAPLFWLAVGGVPAMVAYKMVNTLDSMIGYRSERYAEFGRVAARIDDAANWIPARLTAVLMIAVTGRPALWSFVRRFGRAHASPNSGWPEAALAAILDCRFGGAHDYFGQRVEKPHIGVRERPLTTGDMERAIRINRLVEVVAVLLVAGVVALKMVL